MDKATLDLIIADIKAQNPGGTDLFITEDDTIGWESGHEWTFDYAESFAERRPVSGVYVSPVSHWELGVYAA